jgi:ABC-2 type transport system permease protein/Cu-processing system permease protein
MNKASPNFFTVVRAAAAREFLSHRLNRFLYAHVALVILGGLLPLLTPGEALARGASWWLLHAMLYAISLSALLLGLSSAQAEADEFTWLLGQPAGVGPWLVGKATALALLVGGASSLLAVPTVVSGGGSLELLLTVAGALGISMVCALTGLATGFWVRDGIRGLITAIGVWFIGLFGTDLLLLGTAGEPWAQAHPDTWVLPLMINPFDAYRIAVLFSVEHSAFTGFTTGQLTGWWINHGASWLTAIVALWTATTAAIAWLGARRRTD